MKLTALSLTLFCLLSACVTEYKGPMPDLTLKGEAATQEYNKFKFYDGYWMQANKAFRMGPDETLYWSSSLEPVITKVSPEALEKMKQADLWRNLSWIPYGIALGALLIDLGDGNGDISSTSWSVFYIGMGTWYGFQLYQVSLVQDTAQIYNRDLRRQLSPALGINLKF